MAKLTLTDSTTEPPLNLTERSATPSSPASGDIYLDDGTNTASGTVGFRRYTGSVWEDIDVTTTASALALTDATELTITAGSVTKTQTYHSIDTQSDAASDDLDTISGGTAGEVIYIFANNDARSVVVKNGTGNILTFTGNDITLDEDHKVLSLIYDGTNWREISDASSVSGVGGSTGATDNAIIRADGTGGSTVQSSGLIINDSNTLEMADNIISRPVLEDYGETLTTANTGTSYTIDLTNGNVFELTLTGNVTYTFSNPPASGTAGSFTLIQKQDGTGSRTVAWPASVDWAGGAAPTVTATANSVDIFTFLTTDGGTTWYGFVGGQNFS